MKNELLMHQKNIEKMNQKNIAAEKERDRNRTQLESKIYHWAAIRIQSFIRHQHAMKNMFGSTKMLRTKLSHSLQSIDLVKKKYTLIEEKNKCIGKLRISTKIQKYETSKKQRSCTCSSEC